MAQFHKRSHRHGQKWQVQSLGNELYPLPAEFPVAAVTRLLAVARGAERDPRTIAHALWHLAGYGLAMSKSGKV